jgi:transposase
LRSLLRSRKQGHTNEEKSVKRVKLDKLDNFDKELIKTTVLDLFNKNECVTLRKLKAKNCDLEISKYKLWKTLHELGFRYKKIIWEQKVFSRKN